jgi:hypothetical protein
VRVQVGVIHKGRCPRQYLVNIGTWSFPTTEVCVIGLLSNYGQSGRNPINSCVPTILQEGRLKVELGRATPLYFVGGATFWNDAAVAQIPSA